MEKSELSPEAVIVLRELLQHSLSGYSLQSHTGLNLDQLTVAIGELRDQALLRITGGLTRDSFGDAVFSIPIDSLGDAEFLVGHLRPRTSFKRVAF